MSRLASKVKMGFYPTPIQTLREIASFLSFENSSNVLDPCCGEGEALEYVKRNAVNSRRNRFAYVDVASWGVEIDTDRAMKASGNLDEVIQGSIFDARVNPLGSMGLLWLNPPYDTNAAEERDEIKFFKHSIKWLKPDGILVFIVPEGLFENEKNRKLISEYFYDCQVFRVHRDDYPAFKQVVLFGRKRKDRVDVKPFVKPPYEHIEDRGENCKESFEGYYGVLASERPTVFQCGDSITVEEILKNRGQLEKKIRYILNEKERSDSLSPLFPLRKGHLVALLTAGVLNGKVSNSDGNGHILVKGYSERSEAVREDENAVITTNSYKVGIRVIDPNAKRWYDIT